MREASQPWDVRGRDDRGEAADARTPEVTGAPEAADGGPSEVTRASAGARSGSPGRYRHATIAPLGHGVDGSVSVPGSKSLTNRAIFLAMAAQGRSTLRQPLDSDDTARGLEVAEACGCRVEGADGGVVIEGIGASRPVARGSFDVGSAGTVARFLPCFLAFGQAGEWTLRSSQQMARRPMDGLLEALAPFEGAITPLERQGHYPLLVRGQAGSPARDGQTGSMARDGQAGTPHRAGAGPAASHPAEARRAVRAHSSASPAVAGGPDGGATGDADVARSRKSGVEEPSQPRTGRLPAGAPGDGGTDEVLVDASVSSQFLSGILIAAPLLGRRLTIRTTGHIVQSAYVEMTVDCMRMFGADVEADTASGTFVVGPRPYVATDIVIEADASTASYFAALPAICGGSITVPGLRRGTRQPDSRFLAILEEFGCDVHWGEHGPRISRPEGLPRLKGGHTFDLNDCSDIALTTAAVAVFADAPTRITGVEHIRKHESDRIRALAQAMEAFGVRVEELRDGWTIWPGSPRMAAVHTHDDHRVAMSMAIVGLGGAGVTLDDPGCVEKTCPQFYELISTLGARVSFE